MSEVVSSLLSSVAVLLIVIAVIMFGGEPDLSDAIRHYIEKKTEMLSCPNSFSTKDQTH